MWRRLLIIFLTLFFAFTILFISILRSAAVKYSYNPVYTDSMGGSELEEEELKQMEIDYELAFPGKILPDHPLWKLKAIRDKLWLLVTTDQYKKAELNLLLADKRLSAAAAFFENGDYELGYSTLTKAEKYFESACLIEEKLRSKNMPTEELLDRLARAALKHRQMIRIMVVKSPDQMKPDVVLWEDFAREIYNNKAFILRGVNKKPPFNPFNGE